VTIEQIIAEGDLVAVRMTWSRTHHGEFRGIAPTGNHVRWPAMMFRRIAHGMVVEGWGGGDRWRLYSELGAVPTSS
jgi:predicted ester cyclase